MTWDDLVTASLSLVYIPMSGKRDRTGCAVSKYRVATETSTRPAHEIRHKESKLTAPLNT